MEEVAPNPVAKKEAQAELAGWKLERPTQYADREMRAARKEPATTRWTRGQVAEDEGCAANPRGPSFFRTSAIGRRQSGAAVRPRAR
eukprot:scaffold16006_cov110-Isochrysis_galbana.AAC.3